MQTQYMDVCKLNRPSLPNIPIEVGPTTSRGLCCLPGNITGQSKPLMNPLVSGSSADWALQRVGLWSVRLSRLRSLVITACIICGIIFARGRRQALPLRGSYPGVSVHIATLSSEYALSAQPQIRTDNHLTGSDFPSFTYCVSPTNTLILPGMSTILFPLVIPALRYQRTAPEGAHFEVDCTYKIEIYSNLKTTIHSYDM